MKYQTLYLSHMIHTLILGLTDPGSVAAMKYFTNLAFFLFFACEEFRSIGGKDFYYFIETL